MTRRRVLPVALQSAQVKLKRANLHAKTAEREGMRFFNKYPQPTYRGHFEGDPNKIGSRGVCWIYVATGYPDVPDSFAARFGDAIHNYRCVLDHIAWQLVKHGGDPDPEEPWRVQFPIYDKPRRFKSNKARRLPGVGRGPLQFIQARQPYTRWKEPNNPLEMLARFSNEDKHQTLRVVAAGLAGMKLDFDCTDCFALPSFVAPTSRPTLKAGALITAFPVEFTGPNPEVDVKLAPTGCIALEKSGEMDAVLAHIRDEVAEILNAPEITDAVV